MSESIAEGLPSGCPSLTALGDVSLGAGTVGDKTDAVT